MKEKKRGNKLFIVIVVLSIIIIIAGVLYFAYQIYREQNKLEVLLVDNLEVEINSEVYLLSFIYNIKNGQIITKNSIIDTSSLGSKELELSIKNNYGDVEKYKFNILIKDTVKPIIKAENEISIYAGSDIDLYKSVTVTDNSLEEIKPSISGEYNTTKAGEYKLKYIAKDSSGNYGEYDFILKVIVDKNNRTFTTSKGFIAKVSNGVTYIDGILIANKTYALPSTYGTGLTKELTTAFNKMKEEAGKQGLNLYISSGFRSYTSQNYIYNNYVKRDGQTVADTYSARPGHSEHQTGLAIDINTIATSFAYTNEGKWVAKNCYKYGFIIRYPYGKDGITGYMYEPWHLRYVGVDLASKLYNDGNWITLEEYFGIDSKYS